jgi:hypothetical protein
MRAVLIILAAAALAACDASATQDAPVESQADTSVEAMLATARMLYHGQDYVDAQQSLERAVQPAMLDHFSQPRRREVIDLYAEAAWWGGDYAKAHWAWKLATDDAEAGAEEWQGRLMSAAAVRDSSDAFVAFDHLRQSAPQDIQAIAPRLLAQIDADFGVLPNASTAQRQLAEVLFPLEDSDPRADYNPMWLQAATASLEAGATDQAAKYARRISSPLVMAQLRADRRFDALVASNPGAFEVPTVALAELTNAKAQAASEPGRLAPQLRLGNALYRMGRYQEALAVLDAGLAGGQVYGEDPSYMRSLVSRRVTLLGKLGRNVEALAVASTGCVVCGRGAGFNLQQAQLLISLRRGAEALPLLDGDQPAAFGVAGVADLAAMRACAYHQAGRAADVSTQLDFLKRHVRDNPDATLGALLCAGSSDDVASTLVAMLNDGQMRAAALGALQVYREGKLPPETQLLRARLATIAARSDVKAALDMVGRVATYEMPRPAVVG